MPQSSGPAGSSRAQQRQQPLAQGTGLGTLHLPTSGIEANVPLDRAGTTQNGRGARSQRHKDYSCLVCKCVEFHNTFADRPDLGRDKRLWHCSRLPDNPFAMPNGCVAEWRPVGETEQAPLGNECPGRAKRKLIPMTGREQLCGCWPSLAPCSIGG
jgi:hypothetical protein